MASAKKTEAPSENWLDFNCPLVSEWHEKQNKILEETVKNERMKMDAKKQETNNFKQQGRQQDSSNAPNAFSSGAVDSVSPERRVPHGVGAFQLRFYSGVRLVQTGFTSHPNSFEGNTIVLPMGADNLRTFAGMSCGNANARGNGHS